MNERVTALEETVAHLTRTVEDLSEVLARQDGELARLDLPKEHKSCFRAIAGGAATGYAPVDHDLYRTIIDIRRQPASG